MKALICGSIAYDTIMVFQDCFKNHILPDQVHILNVSFLVPELRREYGGCAGNIAYNLKLLGGSPLPMAAVGQDFGPYSEWMTQCGIPQEHIWEVEDSYTAQAYITTDMDDNQITAFHPGAMNFAHGKKIQVNSNVNIGIISPDGKDGMEQHATQFADAGIPFIFDPGQGLPMFNGEELKRFIDQASWVTLNGYEAQLVQERTGLSPKQIAERVKAVIVTHGGDGSEIFTQEQSYEIPVAKPNKVVDPTGCGDAYRAGLIYGLLEGMDWKTIGRIASLMGATKVESSGTQNHSFEMTSFRDRFRNNFGYAL